MLVRFFFITAILLAACNPLHQQNTALPEVPESYHHQKNSSVSFPDRWWEAFSDPQLNRLQEKMLSGNLDLRQALYRLEQLEALRRVSGASLWPSLSVNGSASRDHSPTANGSSTTDSYRASFAANYEVDLWNRLHDKENAAELRRQAGEKEVQTLLLSLTAQLADNYFQAIEKHQQRELLERQIDNNEALLASATDRYRAGLATSEEIYQAQSSLAAQQARLPQLETALSRNMQAISLLLGQPVSEQHLTTNQLPKITMLPAIGIPASLLNQRPDVAAAFLQLQAADAEFAAALADRLPAINLSAAIGQSSTHLASGDINGAFWNLAASLAQPILDGGRKQAEATRRRASRDEQLAHLQKSLLTAIQEVETALIADQNSTDRHQRLTQQSDISTRSLALSRANYRSGLVSSTQLLATELQHLSILSQRLTTRQEWLRNRISLARALGGTWMSAEMEKQQNALNAAED